MNTKLFAAALLASVLTGCACGGDRIVLLPNAQGKVGKLMVKHRGGETLLDAAYSSADVSGRGQVDRQTLSRADVKKDFGAELAGLPPRPSSYYLYYIGDSDQLTEESRARAPEILDDIARRPAAEVVVIGHTDTVGTSDYNDNLSMARAMAVKNQLMELGFAAARISVAGRGERDLMVPTADEVTEPRNRCAEVNVR